MSPKITQAQLNANEQAYKVDDFRQMVNYVSGTNKGYVRFSLGQDGKLKLEKFNNKVDVPLSWRSNTKAEHNRAIREKFADALARDLKYAGNTGLRIRSNILSPKDREGQIQEGKALSRRDIKAALEDFDKVFNTPGGRLNLLENFFKAAMKECNYEGDVEIFKRDWMKLDAKGFGAETLMGFCNSAEGEGPQRERMVKSEMEFRTLIARLEGFLDEAKMRVGVDSGLKKLVQAALEKGDAFGLDVANQGGGKLLSDIRAGMTGLLGLKGVKNADAHLQTFLEKVLPFYLQDGIANVRDYAGGDKTKQAEAIEANFDFEKLVDLAADFINEAREAEKKPGGPEPLAENDYGILHQLMETVSHTKENNEIKFLVWNSTAHNAAVSPEQARNFADEIVSMKELFRSEAAVDNCAARFVIKHFARGAENMIKQDATALDKVKEFVQKELVPALQIQYGERWEDGKGGYMQGPGVQNFIKRLTDHILKTVGDVGGDKALYRKLFSHTLPDIINNRIDKAIKGNDRMHFEGGEGGGIDAAVSQINRVAMAWRDFRNGKAGMLAEKAIEGFARMLARQQKKGNITEEEQKSLLGAFRTRIENAVVCAIDRYFEAPPPKVESNDIEDLLKDVKLEVQRIVQFFNEEKNAAISEMSQRLNTTILSHSIGGGAEGVKVKRELLDASTTVKGFVEALAKREPPLDPQLAGPSLYRGLEKLYFKTLAAMLQDRKVGQKPVDGDFAKDLHAKFAKLAAEYVEKAEKFGKKINEAVRKRAIDAINGFIDDEKNAMHGYAKLGKADRNTLVSALADDTVLAEHDRIGTLKARFLEDPETYSDAPDNIVAREFDHDDTPQNIKRTAARAGKERILAAVAWLDEDEQGRTFKTRLLEDEELRLRKAHPEISGAEIANIAKERTDAVMKRVVEFPILYTIGGRDKFAGRIGKELADSSDKRMTAYSAFRTQFMKLAEASMAKCSSLGKEKLDARLKMVLDDASRKDPLPDAKIQARAFDKMLVDMVNGIIEKKFDEYLEYSRKYTEAFENATPVLNGKMETRIAELKEAGATDDDIDFFRKTIAPSLRERMEFEIGAEPDDWLGAAGRDKAAKFFDDRFNSIKNAVASVKLDPSNDKEFEGALRTMLGYIGLEEFMNDPTTRAAVKSNVETWLKGDTVKDLSRDMRRAMMTLCIYNRGSQAEPAKAALATVDRFYASLRTAVTGIQSQILMKDFNNTQLEPALKLFELWLEKYNLPKAKFRRASGGETTLKELAMEHFTKRVKDLQQRIVDKGAVAEPLLSQEYLKSFLQYINENGATVMLGEMRDVVRAREAERIMKKAVAGIFDERSARENGSYSANVIAAITVNWDGLNKFFDMNMDAVEREMCTETPTVESLQRWRENIEERFAKYMRNTNSFMMSCETRVQYILQLETLTENAQMFIKNALAERFGGEDIATSAKVPENIKNDVQKFVQDVTETFMKQMKISAGALRKKALDPVNPLKPQEIFKTDAISNDFRTLAARCVNEACKVKDYKNLVRQIDKKLDIQHK